MATWQITTPVEGFTGDSAGVVFAGGVGTVDDSTPEGRSQLAYFGRRGYGLTALDDDTAPAPAAPTSPPAKNAAKAEWVAYAVTRGADQTAAEALTVAQLIDTYGS